jgi:hypothetical protein
MGSAAAQHNIPASVPLTPTGYQLKNGSLYLKADPKLQGRLPLSLAFGIKTPKALGSRQQGIIDSRAGSTTAGLLFYNYAGQNADFSFNFGPQTSAGINCGNAGHVCARSSLIADDAWHEACVGLNSDGAVMSIDGVRVDSNTLPVTYVPATGYWTIGNRSGANADVSLRDLWVYSKRISTADCWQLNFLAEMGLSPAGGSLTQNVILHLPMDNCDATGCADISGSGLNAVRDTNPTVSVTSPSNNATGLTKTVSVAASCIDPVAVGSVMFFVDDAEWSSITASPFTFNWDSTKLIDGSHSIYAVCTNAGGAQVASSKINVSTSNGVSAKTIYLDPTSAIDCPTNNGLSPTNSGGGVGPCATLPGLQAAINTYGLNGGDSILFKAGTNLTVTDLSTANILTLIGPSCQPPPPATIDFTCSAQNTFPGARITISSYGGSGNCTVLAGPTAISDCVTLTLANWNGTGYWRNHGVLQLVNIPNVLIQNFRIINAGNFTTATSCPPGGAQTGCGSGIRYVTSNGYYHNGANTIIQNNEIIDFFNDLYVSSTIDQGRQTAGTLCGPIVQNNYLHGSTVTSPGSNGFMSQAPSCAQGTSGPTSLTILSNYTANQGGIGGGAAGVNSGAYGSGITVSDGFYNIVDNYNATTAIDGNFTACVNSGGGYGNWWFTGKGVVAIGNESYNSWAADQFLVQFRYRWLRFRQLCQFRSAAIQLCAFKLWLTLGLFCAVVGVVADGTEHRAVQSWGKWCA